MAARVEPLLPNKPRGSGAGGTIGGCWSGIFYVLGGPASPWRDLPERYGAYTTVYNRFN